MNGNRYTEIHQHGSYIILLVSGSRCMNFLQVTTLGVSESSFSQWCQFASIWKIKICRELFSITFGFIKLWTLVSPSWSQINREVTICNKTQEFQHKAHTWNCKLGILMIIRTEAIQLKTLYRWRCWQCEIWVILGELTYLDNILLRIFTNVQLTL